MKLLLVLLIQICVPYLVGLNGVATLFGQSLNTIWSNSLGDGIPYGFKKTGSGDFIVIGNQNYSVANNVILTLVDSSGSIIWTETYDDEYFLRGYSVDALDDGGFIAVGIVKHSSTETSDIWIMRTDSSGSIIWSRTLGGESHDEGYLVRAVDGGHIMVMGEMDGMIIAELNLNGDTRWIQSLPLNWCHHAIPTRDHGFLAVGTINNTASTFSDMGVVKLDSSGNELWVESYGSTLDLDRGYYATEGHDTGYVLVGDTRISPTTFMSEFSVKIGESGEHEWSSSFDFLSGHENADRGDIVIQTSESGYIIAGSTTHDSLVYADPDFPIFELVWNYWILSIDNMGHSLWSHEITDRVVGIEETAPNEYVVCLHRNGEIVLEKFQIEMQLGTNHSSNCAAGVEQILSYPNPFNSTTLVQYALPTSGFVDVSIYNIRGEKAATLVQEEQSSGNHAIAWNASGYPSGIYFCRLESAGSVQISIRLVLLR